MDTRDGIKAIAAVRTGFGVALLLAPGLARLWIGDAADRPAVRVAIRGFGARDLGLGLGTLLALRHEAPVRGWLEAGMLADVADAVASLLGARHLPSASRVGVPVAGLGAAAFGRMLIADLEE